MADLGIKSVALPALGCGQGGLALERQGVSFARVLVQAGQAAS